MEAAPHIRLATRDDLGVINGIYNHYVAHSTCTFQTGPETMAAREVWFGSHDPKIHPITVIEASGEILGWASLSPYHSRCGYRSTVEDSVYLRHDRLGRGMGRALLADLCERSRSIGHHTIIAGVSADQEASVVLHEKLGFVRVAHLREVGYKFDRWLDVIYLQRMI